jgi:hypothetical protein
MANVLFCRRKKQISHSVALVVCKTAKIHDKLGKAVNRTMNDKIPVNQAMVDIKMPQAVWPRY